MGKTGWARQAATVASRPLSLSPERWCYRVSGRPSINATNRSERAAAFPPRNSPTVDANRRAAPASV